VRFGGHGNDSIADAPQGRGSVWINVMRMMH
jgi:hypothetical protein